MFDLVTRLREWLGVPHTPDAEKELVERTIQLQERRVRRLVRLARTDAEVDVRAARTKAHR